MPFCEDNEARDPRDGEAVAEYGERSPALDASGELAFEPDCAERGTEEAEAAADAEDAEPRAGEAAPADSPAHTRPHARAPWYAVQVTAGREEHMREAIERAAAVEQRLAEQRSEASGTPDPAPVPAAERLFVPKARVGVQRGGKWVPGEEVLLPGYLIAETRDPAALTRALRRASGFARAVRRGEAIEPMPDAAVRWVDAHTLAGEVPAEMSEGYIEDGVLHVTAGPLKGREADVTYVNHRKKVAYLQMEAFGTKITAQLGIRITRNRSKKKSCKKDQITE